MTVQSHVYSVFLAPSQSEIALSFGESTMKRYDFFNSSLSLFFLATLGSLLRVFCVLRGVHGGSFRDSSRAGVPRCTLLVVCLLHQIQRAVQRLPLASYGESHLLNETGNLKILSFYHPYFRDRKPFLFPS